MSEAQSETLNFQTEAKQLLQLMIHSLYSNREIFLRELISNASDAIDKLRFLSIEDQSLLGDDSEFHIDISFDADAKTLTIFDNGIGMNRDEVIAHLGTIAKSGTAEFLSNLTGDQKSDSQLIGQFGVGFYSAFMVADKVEVCTLSAQGGDGVRWQSTGEDAYSLEVVEGLARGTQVILHLKEDALDFAEDFRLRNIVVRYSDHIGVPVRMLSQPAPAEEGEEAPAAEFEAVNSAQALWTRSRSEVEDAEYQEFYKHISHDFEEPLAWSHNRVEGKFEYTSLVYVPKRAPFDLYNREVPKGLKLYVQRVFIMDDAEQFLPLYLRFVKGVIDSNDLPLNVSREILQQDDRVTSIRNAVTKRVLSMLEDMAKKDPEQYQLFWDEFGEVLKEGAGEDFANRAALTKLLRFASTHESAESGKKVVGLEQYLERKVEGQDTIYYICAEAYETASRSPHLEIFKERGVEVLVLFDRIDEWLMSSLTDYEGTKFVDVMRGDVTLPGEETAKDGDDEAKDKDEDEHPLVERIAAVVGEKVKGVRPSKRLTGSPACLVLSEDAMGIQMRRIMEASGQSMPESKPFFEFNPNHLLVERLENEVDEDRFAELVGVLFDQASLAEGGSLQDPAGYVERLNRLLLELL
ncbi:MAG: molecular chaperone HtpG [Gammaproteobacteria bacterium]|jgi:molecular chaperone HtpG|nr:molecular chaperone HtpG [Gammaproteobacteria bacterium]